MADPDRLEALQAFASLVTDADAALQHAAAEIKDRGEELKDREAASNEAFWRMGDDVGSLEQALQEAEIVAETEATHLKETAAQAHLDRLPTVVDAMSHSEDELEAVFRQEGQELDGAFASLDTDGVSVLESGLEARQSDFEGWTAAGEGSLTHLDESLTGALAELRAADTQIVDSLGEASRACARGHQLLHGVHSVANRIGSDLVHELDTQSSVWAGEVEDMMKEILMNVGTSIEERQHALEGSASIASQQVLQEMESASTAVETTTHALDAAQHQFDQAAVDVASSQTVTSSAEALAPGVRHAEAEVNEIQALLDSVGTP